MVKRPKSRLLVACTTIRSVAGHGYMSSPRSRNYVANDSTDWDATSSSLPYPEDCPQCLNLGGTMARCGYVNYRTYDEPKTIDGERMPFVSQATYSDGDTIDITTEITAYHKGHFEFKVCPLDSPDEIASQECFDQYPLTFVEDLLYGAGKDSSYPYRAYMAGDYKKFIHRMKLPDGLTGSHVLLQWHWLTASTQLEARLFLWQYVLISHNHLMFHSDSCYYPGYIEYYANNPRLKESAKLIKRLDECPQLSPDGNGVPEQFWNCAEITILPKVSNSGQEKNDVSSHGAENVKDNLDSAPQQEVNHHQNGHNQYNQEESQGKKDKNKDKIEKNQLPEEGIIHHEESHLTGAELFVNFVHESRIKDQKVERTKADKKKERRKHKSDVM